MKKNILIVGFIGLIILGFNTKIMNETTDISDISGVFLFKTFGITHTSIKSRFLNINQLDFVYRKDNKLVRKNIW